MARQFLQAVSAAFSLILYRYDLIFFRLRAIPLTS